jgi:hypothetical protein
MHVHVWRLWILLWILSRGVAVKRDHYHTDKLCLPVVGEGDSTVLGPHSNGVHRCGMDTAFDLA